MSLDEHELKILVLTGVEVLTRRRLEELRQDLSPNDPLSPLPPTLLLPSPQRWIGVSAADDVKVASSMKFSGIVMLLLVRIPPPPLSPPALDMGRSRSDRPAAAAAVGDGLERSALKQQALRGEREALRLLLGASSDCVLRMIFGLDIII